MLKRKTSLTVIASEAKQSRFPDWSVDGWRLPRRPSGVKVFGTPRNDKMRGFSQDYCVHDTEKAF